MQNDVTFEERFNTPEQVRRYRDRYLTGRHKRIDLKERVLLRKILLSIGQVSVAMDLPCGTGRLTTVLAEFAKKVVLADSSATMLGVARNDHPHLPAEYLLTNAENISLPATINSVLVANPVNMGPLASMYVPSMTVKFG